MLLVDSLEGSGRIQGLHEELRNSLGPVGSGSGGEGMKGGEFNCRPTHQTSTDPLKTLKVSK